MIRRFLRRHLLPRPAPPSPSSATPTEWAHLAEARCLDLRPSGALRHGVVEGALLLTEALALRLPLPESPPLVVLHSTGPQTAAAAHALGLPAGPGLEVWCAAGARLRLPDEKAPLVLRQAVLLDTTGEEGWVQDISWGGHEFFYTVEFLREGALVRLSRLPEEALTARDGRGAAGLGAQIGGDDDDDKDPR